MTQDLKRLAAEVSVQHGIRIDPDDPIMAVVTLNRLMLESAVADAEDRIRRVASEFSDGAKRLESRAGNAAAAEVRACAAAIRAELSKDIAAAGVRAAELVSSVDAAHARTSRLRWMIAGLLLAILLFLAGVGVGSGRRLMASYHQSWSSTPS